MIRKLILAVLVAVGLAALAPSQAEAGGWQRCMQQCQRERLPYHVAQQRCARYESRRGHSVQGPFLVPTGRQFLIYRGTVSVPHGAPPPRGAVRRR